MMERNMTIPPLLHSELYCSTAYINPNDAASTASMYNLSLWVLEPIVFVLRLPSYHPIPVLRVCRFLKYARPEAARILRDSG